MVSACPRCRCGARGGVAPSTVSYVLSGKRAISAETRARVEVESHGSATGPASARALASASTKIVGLVVPLRTDVNVPVIMQFVAAITLECASATTSTSICSPRTRAPTP